MKPNANKVEHIRHMNTLLGLSIPIITTPLQLINEGLSNENDPTIDRIRTTRHEISEEFDHDPEKLVKYYMKYQKKYKNLIKSTKSSDYCVSSKKLENITRQQ